MRRRRRCQYYIIEILSYLKTRPSFIIILMPLSENENIEFTLHSILIIFTATYLYTEALICII